MMKKFRLFAMNASRSFGAEVAYQLDQPLCSHQEDIFSDREQYARALTNVRGKRVFVIQSLYSDETEAVGEKFLRLLFFIGALRDASAEQITVVVPYLAYYRQDRKTQSRAPITTKYIAQMLESMGARRLLTMDVHSPTAMQNAFRKCTPDNLEAVHLLTDAVCEKIKEEEQNQPVRDFTVVSPDEGGIARGLQAQNLLSKKLNREIGFAFVDKRHKPGTGSGLISSGPIVGQVANRNTIVWDDMISSGSTIKGATTRIVECGGNPWGIAAVHPLWVGNANENMKDVGHIFVTNTINSGRMSPEILEKTTMLSASRLFAQAIKRIYYGASISELIETGG